MQFNIILKENSPYTYYCPRPLVKGDVRAYRIVIKTEEILEGAHLLITAVRSDGQTVTDIGTMYGGYGEYTLASNMYAIEGDMRLLISIVDFDGASLTAKEVLFTVTDGGDDTAIDGEDRLPVLNRMISQCNELIKECTSLTEGYGEIINLYTNLLSPEHVHYNESNGTVNISGLEKGKAYCFNFTPYEVYGISDNGEAETVPYTTDGTNTYISANDMNYNSISIPFKANIDSRYFMMFEGEVIPDTFKAYGQAAFFNDYLLSSVYAEINQLKDEVITSEINSDGVVALSNNKIHCLTIDRNMRFALPYTQGYSTITVQAKVNSSAYIDWGTTYFFKNEIPYIEPGEYDFFFEYDGGWYVGVVPKGQVIV